MLNFQIVTPTFMNLIHTPMGNGNSRQLFPINIISRSKPVNVLIPLPILSIPGIESQFNSNSCFTKPILWTRVIRSYAAESARIKAMDYNLLKCISTTHVICVCRNMGYMSTRRRVTTSQPHVSFPCDFWTENPQPYFCNLRPSSLS